MDMEEVIFLKLGGSLITDKNQPHTARLEVIHRLVQEIKKALKDNTGLQLLIGHGSGSFGHVPGKKYNTRKGVNSESQWLGFVEVWHEARALTQILLEAFRHANLPVIAFPPSAAAISSNGAIQQWNYQPISMALQNGIIPLINGDVLFDLEIGGTILSTEDLFETLALHLKPEKILLAGIETGVWKDFPQNTELIKHINSISYSQNQGLIGKSKSIDVTGGMQEKVKILLRIIKHIPDCQGMIFSGMIPGNILSALGGNVIGTVVSNKKDG
jgi:isopentenyl phosphate kinase